MKALILLLITIILLPLIPPQSNAADDEFVIGVFPRRNYTTTIKMFTPLAAHISRKLGRKVVLKTARDFKTFWDGVTENRYDLVHFNQYQYVKAKKLFGYRVIAKNEEFGTSTISSVLVIRKDSEFKSVRDLKDKIVIFGGGRSAMMAYIMPTSLLLRGGLEKNDYIEKFSINPPNAALAVYFKQAAAGGAGNFVLQLPVVNKTIDTNLLKYLVVGEPMAHLPWAVKRNTKPEDQKILQEILTSLKYSEEGRRILKKSKLTGLVAATDAEYDHHRRIIREVLGEKY